MSPSPAASSSSTLWATASKEWVIPPKPKPGRKPKKEAALHKPSLELAPSPTASADSSGRRVQNRAAQRAFRERKQSQLAELQARIQQYEQGEIERNIALQQVAKRLKDENDNLREENFRLSERLALLERERDAFASTSASAATAGDPENKRTRDRSPFPADSNDVPTRKKTRLAIDDMAAARSSAAAASLSLFSSPPSLVSSPSGSEHTSDSPAPDPAAHQSPMFPEQIVLGGVFDFQSAPPGSGSRPSVFESAVPTDTFDCGFCNENTPCMCREIAMQTRQNPPSMDTFKVEALEEALQTDVSATLDANRPNILDNPPAYQPAVPLRRRLGSSQKSIFPVVPAGAADCSAGPETAGATCSGDPSNCAACADDAFGRAFCSAVGEAVASQGPCSDCPGKGSAAAQTADGGAVRLCCGNPSVCGAGAFGSQSNTTSNLNEASEKMPTSEAWRQIKSHPNVEFSDLALLADVVARRSKCTGPTVVIEPALGSITPERSATPATAAATFSELTGAVLLSDPHAHYRQKQQERVTTPVSPPPTLVPHEELLACSQRRAPREVHADGVREALRMLDAKFGQT